VAGRCHAPISATTVRMPSSMANPVASGIIPVATLQNARPPMIMVRLRSLSPARPKQNAQTA
jgi:hypothetical protein